MSNGFQHDTNRARGKRAVAHNRHSRHGKQIRAMGKRRRRRQGRALGRQRVQGWAA